MAEARPFAPVKLVCGILAGDDLLFEKAEAALSGWLGPIDRRSGRHPFDCTGYYDAEMGSGLKRSFVSFPALVEAESLPEVKIKTNALEEDLRKECRAAARVVNLDPGILTKAALIMATAKDFSHRVPLRSGIYAHLELLFGRGCVRYLEWTYPDFRDGRYDAFFLQTRADYLKQLKERGVPLKSG